MTGGGGVLDRSAERRGMTGGTAYLIDWRR
jgi:hypothetical protein